MSLASPVETTPQARCDPVFFSTLLALDACSAINLIASDSLDVVVSIPELSFCVGPIVVRECGSLFGAVLRKHAENGTILRVHEDDIPGARYLELLSKYALGEGETECLAICEQRQFRLVSDDAAARKAGAELLGSDRVTGSLGLLRACVAAGLLRRDDAFDRYQRMVDNGAFLPSLDIDFFKP